MKIVRYDPKTGRIDSVQTMDDLLMTDAIREFMGEEGVLYLPSVYTARISDLNQYVHAGVVVDRPLQPITLEGRVLKGVLAGATVTIEGIDYNVYESEDIELEFSHVGVYEVKVVHWPYHDWSANVENQA